jgi:hypothetical protein
VKDSKATFGICPWNGSSHAACAWLNTGFPSFQVLNGFDCYAISYHTWL